MSLQTETLTIELPSDLAANVRSAVESGQYASASDMVRAALDDYLRIEFEEPDIETLRRLCQEGIDSGPGQGLTIDEIKAEGRRRLSQA